MFQVNNKEKDVNSFKNNQSVLSNLQLLSAYKTWGRRY